VDMPARHIAELVAEACGLVEHVADPSGPGSPAGSYRTSAAAVGEELEHLRALLQALSYQTLDSEAAETARGMVTEIDEALATLTRQAGATERIAG